jgi:hypothetical protein
MCCILKPAAIVSHLELIVKIPIPGDRSLTGKTGVKWGYQSQGGPKRMRLRLLLPRVEPSEINAPSSCPYEDCEGRHLRFHQEVNKPLQDTVYPAVAAHRYECLRCTRTFRVYPVGVSESQTSQRVQGLAVMLGTVPMNQGWRADNARERSR